MHDQLVCSFVALCAVAAYYVWEEDYSELISVIMDFLSTNEVLKGGKWQRKKTTCGSLKFGQLGFRAALKMYYNKWIAILFFFIFENS